MCKFYCCTLENKSVMKSNSCLLYALASDFDVLQFVYFGRVYLSMGHSFFFMPGSMYKL
jgi:hypothetical protein